MEKINALIRHHSLRVIDAIVLKKKLIGMVDHYVLFGGYDKFNQPVFVANYHDGVKVVPKSDLLKFMEIMEPTEVVYFNGNEAERNDAIVRAKSRIGERAYNYLSNNCEHFVTWVHTGKHRSKQVANTGTGLMVAGAAGAIGGLASKNNKVALVSAGALALGALLRFGFNDEE